MVNYHIDSVHMPQLGDGSWKLHSLGDKFCLISITVKVS